MGLGVFEIILENVGAESEKVFFFTVFTELVWVFYRGVVTLLAQGESFGLLHGKLVEGDAEDGEHGVMGSRG